MTFNQLIVLDQEPALDSQIELPIQVRARCNIDFAVTKAFSQFTQRVQEGSVCTFDPLGGFLVHQSVEDLYNVTHSN